MIYGRIYGLHLGDYHFRYVGQTVIDINTRRDQHVYNALLKQKSPVYDWIRKHSTSKIHVALIEQCGTAQDLDEAERKWIAIFRHQNGNLLNVLDGGQGSRGYKWTEDQKAALCLRMKGVQKGRQFSDDTRAKMSIAAKQRPHRKHTEESKQRMRDAKKAAGWRPTEAQKQHLREVNTGKKHSKSTKDLISKKAKERGKTAEHEQRIASSLQRRGRCNICDFESNVTALGRHKSKTGHEWTRL